MDDAVLHSVVVPVYDEEEVLPRFHERCRAVLEGLGEPWELIYVDDGSSDTSWEVMSAIAAREPSVRLVRLSRNFGHQVAITAGLDCANGATVTVIDADLQDPPEVVPGVDRPLARRGRHRLCGAHQAQRREALQAGYRLCLLSPDALAGRRRHAGRRRRLSPAQRARRRSLAQHAGARPLRSRHGGLDRL